MIIDEKAFKDLTCEGFWSRNFGCLENLAITKLLVAHNQHIIH